MTFDFGKKRATGGGFNFGGPKRGENDTPETFEEGTLERDAGEELQQLESAYVQRRKAEDKRRENATDSEYWFAVYFESRTEKEAFLKAIGAKKKLHGDKYLDGRKLAKLLNIEM